MIDIRVLEIISNSLGKNFCYDYAKSEETNYIVQSSLYIMSNSKEINSCFLPYKLRCSLDVVYYPKIDIMFYNLQDVILKQETSKFKHNDDKIINTFKNFKKELETLLLSEESELKIVDLLRASSWIIFIDNELNNKTNNFPKADINKEKIKEFFGDCYHPRPNKINDENFNQIFNLLKSYSYISISTT